MTASESSKTWCVIIPAYREEARIADVVRGVLAHGMAAIVVDDGSDDATAPHAESAGAQVMRHPTNRGKGAALQTGFAFLREKSVAAWIVTMDADGQHAPADLPLFRAAAERDRAAVLIGNRMNNLRDMPPLRRLTNRAMSALLSRLIGQTVPDTQCGYRAYRADTLPYLFGGSAHYEAESESLVKLGWAGFRIESVPVQTIYGEKSSKINPVADTYRFFAMLLRLRRERRREMRH